MQRNLGTVCSVSAASILTAAAFVGGFLASEGVMGGLAAGAATSLVFTGAPLLRAIGLLSPKEVRWVEGGRRRVVIGSAGTPLTSSDLSRRS